MCTKKPATYPIQLNHPTFCRRYQKKKKSNQFHKKNNSKKKKIALAHATDIHHFNQVRSRRENSVNYHKEL